MVPVFKSLAEYANCLTDTASQLLNAARRMSTESPARHVQQNHLHWPMGAQGDLMNVNTLAPIVNGGGCISLARREPRVSATVGTPVALDVLNASGLPVKSLCEQRVSEDFLAVNILAPIVNDGGCISPARREQRVSATIGTRVALDVLNASGLPVKPLCE